jgi:D-glycero-D-manno-heptose 1,7-bisphosphate phosphatase
MGIGSVTAGRAVFLDRDGTLNEPIVRDGKPYPPASTAGLEISPGAGIALGRLKAAGFLLIVVTNQPDIARGALSREAVEEVNAAVCAALPIDDVFVCWHDDKDQCDCRKPKPGLILRASAKHGIGLDRSFLIGDRWRDIDAGAAAGCRTILLDRRYQEREPDHAPDFRAATLGAAADWILGQRDFAG